MDRLGDGEDHSRAPVRPLRLHQKRGRLLRLVPRSRSAQEGVHGRGGSLIRLSLPLHVARSEALTNIIDVS